MNTEPSTTTANGAPSFSTTMDARLDLFVKTVRDISDDALFELVDKSWLVSPLDTMKILVNWRDCRGGKGDYKGFISAMVYIQEKHTPWFLANFKILPEYGSWLDMVKLWHQCNAQGKELIMEYLVEQTRHDMAAICDANSKQVSLLAKWLPSENAKWDRFSKEPKERFVINFCKTFFACCNHVKGNDLAQYRKMIVAPLRAHLKLVETNMCAKDYAEIKYESVPSVAMKKYRKAFLRNDPTNFNDYLEQVKAGTKKINAGQVYPHDLVRHYINGGLLDEVIEEQWKVIKETATTSNAFANSICVCDVSGSMEGTPMEVAIALGLLGLHNDRVVTFSESPILYKITQGTLQDQVKNIMNMPWGFNTNLEKTMDLVLAECQDVQRVFIYSDMQFDVAIGHYSQHTLFQTIKAKYQAENATMPQIVFWNLSGQTNDFPVVANEQGVVMLSGYSPALLTALVSGGDISPLTMMLKVINAPRYDKIVAP